MFLLSTIQFIERKIYHFIKLPHKYIDVYRMQAEIFNIIYRINIDVNSGKLPNAELILLKTYFGRSIFHCSLEIHVY